MTIPEHSIEHLADGSAAIRVEGSGIFTADGNGCVSASITAIKAVGILDIADITSHTINTIAGSRSHIIHFINGGILQYAYNSAGQLIALSSDKLDCQYSCGSQKMVYWIAEGQGSDIYIVD